MEGGRSPPLSILHILLCPPPPPGLTNDSSRGKPALVKGIFGPFLVLKPFDLTPPPPPRKTKPGSCVRPLPHPSVALPHISLVPPPAFTGVHGTPLHLAAIMGHAAAARALAEKQASLDELSPQGLTAVHIACINGHLEVGAASPLSIGGGRRVCARGRLSPQKEGRGVWKRVSNLRAFI